MELGYALSLVSRYKREGLIHKGTEINLRSQLMAILKELIMDFTKGESTSIKEEVAQNLLASICYAIDTAVCSYPDDKRYSYIMSKRLKGVYNDGIYMLNNMMNETKAIYREVMKSKLDIPLEIYNSTLDGIGRFFKDYSILYSAHDTVADIDYPLVLDEMSEKGLIYIREYLLMLRYETAFVQYFSFENVLKLLDLYGKYHGFNYTKGYFNIFEICFIQSFLAVLAGKSAFCLELFSYDLDKAAMQLRILESSDVDKALLTNTKKMITELGVEEKKVIEYINEYFNKAFKRIKIACDQGNLLELGLIKQEESVQLKFKDGDRIGQKRFRRIIAELNNTNSIKEKIASLKNSIHSLKDFIDVMEADVFYRKEFAEVFVALDFSYLAILYKYFKGRNSIAHGDNEIEHSEGSWGFELMEYIKALPANVSAKIIELADQLELDEDLLPED